MPILLTTILLLLAAGAVRQDLSGAPDGATLPVAVEIPAPPIAVPADGKQVIAYELHVTNLSPEEIVLTGLDVQATGSSSVIMTIPADVLAKITLPWSPSSASHPLTLGPGVRATIFMYFSASAVPARGFQHRLHYTSLGRGETLVTAPMPVRSDALSIQPPVRGGLWRAVNGPNDNTSHRRSIMPYQGRVIVPQRFAIDFLRVDAEGRTYKGDPTSNASYYAYGAETYAVAAATVSFVKDGIPENVPQSADRAVPMAWDTVSGNFVVLDMGGDRVAVYAHLQPGSIRVKAGERVTPGQFIGRVGNSGNSSEPHLHFQLCDTAGEIGALGGDGIPFTFPQFTRDDGSVHRNEIPLRDWNVGF